MGRIAPAEWAALICQGLAAAGYCYAGYQLWKVRPKASDFRTG